MGIYSRWRQRRQQRSIIKEYYGGDNRYFVASMYTQNSYSIPEVRTAIERAADIFSKIPKYNERVDKNGNIVYIENSLTRVLSLKPNPLQNSIQFWKEVYTRLMLDGNVFIEPIWDKTTGYLKSLYVLPTRSFELSFVSDNEGTVTFDDKTTGKQTFNLSSLIYLNRFSSLTGGKKNDIRLYETVIQALMQQAVSVADPKKVRAIMQGKINGSPLLKPEHRGAAMEDVKANFAQNVDGLVYFDSNWQITPINWQENDVNRELLKVITSAVYNYFGITESVINGTADELQFEMFINNSIKPLAIQIEQELTAKLFTQREIEVGNKIELDTFALSVTTLSTKSSFIQSALRNGTYNQDEGREMLGRPPLPDGLGKRWRTTADTVSIDIVDEYQLGKVNKQADPAAESQVIEAMKNENKNVDDTEKAKENEDGNGNTKANGKA